MANRMFFIANFAIALLLFATTIMLTSYGSAVNISMFYLFSVVGVWAGQRIMWRIPSQKGKTLLSSHLLAISGIVLSFFIGFLVLYQTGEQMNSLVGRIIILSVAFINGVYLFIHIYFHKKTIPAK